MARTLPHGIMHTQDFDPAQDCRITRMKGPQETSMRNQRKQALERYHSMSCFDKAIKRKAKNNSVVPRQSPLYHVQPQVLETVGEHGMFCALITERYGQPRL